MLHELQHFLRVVETGTFTAAAHQSHLTQPSLSASIKRLEDAMGARLLHRLPRGAAPTAAGEALLPHARAALAAFEAGHRAVSEVQGLQAGEVRIGGGATACTYLLPPILAAFRAAYPTVTFRLRELFTPRVRAAVAAGELDLGIAMGEDGEAWCTDEIVVVAAPGHVRPIEPGTPFVTFVPGAHMREVLDRHLPEVEVVIELGSIAAVKGLVRAGIGLALLSRAAVADDLALGALVEVADPRLPVRRALVLVHQGLDRLPPAALALREMLLAARVTGAAGPAPGHAAQHRS